MKNGLSLLKGILVGSLIAVVLFWLVITILVGTGITETFSQTQELVKVEAQPLDGIVQEEDTAQVKEAQQETESTEKAEEDIQEAETVVQENVVTITISAAGDCSLGNHQQQDYGSSFVQAYDTAESDAYFFANVLDIFSADDFTIVNLEGVFTTSENRDESRTYNIKGDPSYAGILTSGNVEAVSMANNHRLDFGTEGTKDTVAALEAEGIAYAYDDIICIQEIKGIRLGYLSVNEVAWGYGTETLVKNAIEKLKEEGVDLIIACCHWGIEKDYYPNDYQKELGRKCIDMGADLVLGHHPHVLQGVEEYQGKYIVYSLGNFCFGANRNPADKDTMIFQQTFTFVNGQLQADLDAQVIPCSLSSVSGRNNFQPTPLEGEEKERVIEKLNTLSEGMGVTIAQDGTLIPEEVADAG